MTERHPSGWSLIKNRATCSPEMKSRENYIMNSIAFDSQIKGELEIRILLENKISHGLCFQRQ